MAKPTADLDSATNDSQSTTSKTKTTKEKLNENDEKLIKAVTSNSLDNVINVVNNYQNNKNDDNKKENGESLNINCKDENGMSPLQHACYRGNLSIAKYLIERGANVNQNDHEHRYTSLMFAALGGHKSIINLLLENDANIDMKNTVGRNASQMAAFVGQHQSVAIINNYIPRSYIEYYSRLNGQEKEPRLPIRLISSLHSLVCLVAVNPIRITYFFETNQSLFDEPKKINIVMDHLCEKLFRSNEPNEMLSLKIHYLNFIFNILNDSYEKYKSTSSSATLLIDNENNDNHNHNDNNGKILNKIFQNFIKYCLKLNDKNFPENMERILRQSIRSYMFQENSLFQQLVRTLSTIEIGDEPSTLSILSQTILGKSIGFEENDTCFTCSEYQPTKRCSKCKRATYCDQRCQRLHWQFHKRFCQNNDNNEQQQCNEHEQQQNKQKQLTPSAATPSTITTTTKTIDNNDQIIESNEANDNNNNNDDDDDDDNYEQNGKQN